MASLKYSRQRESIKHYLATTKEHPTADTIYMHVRKEFPNISLGTVYRNLDFLVDTGEIRRLEAAGTTKRFDGDISWHQHVRCIHCGRIGDVMQPLPVPSVAGMQVEGFYSIVDSRVEFDGICEACAAKGLK